MRPSNKTWSLTVRGGSLHLDAPHGSFAVRGMAPEVMQVIAALPDGTDVECDGGFDGGGTITHLVVTKVRRILKDLSGRVMQLPDVVVGADPRLAAARARHYFAAGQIEKAAADVATLLGHGDDQALAEYERLPREHQRALLDAVVAWQAQRPPTWRALQHVPIERWTDAQLERAGELALSSGGVFGAAPGMRLETIVEELERRELPTKSLAKQTQRLRRAQAIEGDTVHRLVTALDNPRVIGGDTTCVFVHGTVKLGEAIVQRGGARQRVEDRESVLVRLTLDGRELQRWTKLSADRVINGVALQIEADEPAGVRLSDGKRLFAFAHRIEHHDGELLWGIHARDTEHRRMRSEIVHIATGFSIAKLDDWIDDVEWNAHQIFIRGAAPQTLTREGRVVALSVPPRPETIAIETATAAQTLPAQHAPWLFDDGYQSIDTGGWIAHHKSRDLYLAPSEPGAGWVRLELEQRPTAIELAPPWLAIHNAGVPIVLVALAEAMSAQQIRVDGRIVVKRAKDVPRLYVDDHVRAWYATLVEQGLLAARSDADRDAVLFRATGNTAPPPHDLLARILVGGASPVVIEHGHYDIHEDDAIYARVNALFAGDDFAVDEIAREDLDPDDSDDAREETKLTLRARRDGKTLKRQCGASVGAVMQTIDKLAEELGTKRRIFAVESSLRCVYVAITKEQRRAVADAGVIGLSTTPKRR